MEKKGSKATSNRPLTAADYQLKQQQQHHQQQQQQQQPEQQQQYDRPPPPYTPYSTNAPCNTNVTQADGRLQATAPASGVESSVRYQAGTAGQASTVVIVSENASAGKPGTAPSAKSFRMYYLLSCLSFWLCWFLFGGIAFALAFFARKKAKLGEQKESHNYSIASLALSVTGFITGCIIWGFLIYYIVDTCINTGDCDYKCKGVCYSDRSYGSDCYDHLDACYQNNDGYCYYNDD